MDTDPFRYCVYCGADCTLGLENPPDDYEPPHVEDCPQVTGLYPVRSEDVYPHGMACCECGRSFAVGDTYSTLLLEQGSDYEVVEDVCLMCAAIGEVTV